MPPPALPPLPQFLMSSSDEGTARPGLTLSTRPTQQQYTLHSPEDAQNGQRQRYSTLPTPFPQTPTARLGISNSPVSPESENGSVGPITNRATMATTDGEELSREFQQVRERERERLRQQQGHDGSIVPPLPALPALNTIGLGIHGAPALAPPSQFVGPTPAVEAQELSAFPPTPALNPASDPAPSTQAQPAANASGRNSRHASPVINGDNANIVTQTVEYAVELPADPSPPLYRNSVQPAEPTEPNRHSLQNIRSPVEYDRDRRLSYITTPPGSPPPPTTPGPEQLQYLPQQVDPYYTNYQPTYQAPTIPAPTYIPPAPTATLTYPQVNTNNKSRSFKRESSVTTKTLSDTYAHGALLSCILHPLIAIWACIAPCTLHTSTQSLMEPEKYSKGFCASLLFLPIYPFATLWRRIAIREKYGLRSGGFKEIFGALCACWCLAVQDYVEVRRREKVARPKQEDLELGVWAR